ncbi:hypothetical protein BpHYR1_022715 [Brachionus plicatilis]|uniref:Uncharacterized protein n=1 Tax=Brachionus plicatilis TaxID=10195 RepID=A0A3M7T748_BRAPC|nr:hypothetical protein BpHYR1_022715 [Brachionus plicatilis]
MTYVSKNYLKPDHRTHIFRQNLYHNILNYPNIVLIQKKNLIVQNILLWLKKMLEIDNFKLYLNLFFCSFVVNITILQNKDERKDYFTGVNGIQ